MYVGICVEIVGVEMCVGMYVEMYEGKYVEKCGNV